MAGLNLLAAIVVYWNTAHLSDAIAQRKDAGLPVEPELPAHMSALTTIDGAVFTVFDGLRVRLPGDERLPASAPARQERPTFGAGPQTVPAAPRAAECACAGAPSLSVTSAPRR